MAGDKRLSARFGADTSDFKNGIVAINREIRVLETGFKASAAVLGDWTKSANGLEQRAKSLNGQIDLQKEKVDALTVEYERLVAEKGKDSASAEEKLIKLNKENEALGKMQVELNGTESSLEQMRSGSDEAADSVTELGNETETTNGLLDGLGVIAGGLGAALAAGVSAVAGLAGAVAGVGKAVTDLVLNTAAASGELTDLSVKTGVSTTRLQEWAYVGDQVGTSQDTIVSAMARMTKGMGEASEQSEDYLLKLIEAEQKVGGLRDELAKTKVGSESYKKTLEELGAAEDAVGKIKMGAQQEAFSKLGISVKDAKGNLRDSEAVFADVLTSLGRIGNDAERDALSMAVFGKSAQELNPLVKAGAEELSRLSEEAHAVGAVMSEEDVAAMAGFQDKLDSLQAGLKGTLGTLAGAFLPGFEGLAKQAGGYLEEFSGVVESSDGDLTKVAEGVGGLAGRIAGDMAAQAPQMLEGGLGIVQGLLGAVTQALPKLLPLAAEMIRKLVQFLIQNLPLMINMAVELVLALVNGIVPQLPMLIGMALQMLITLANGIAAALPTLIPVIVGIIPQIILVLLENLPLLITAAVELIVALAQGLVTAIPILVPEIPKIVSAIFDAIIVSLPIIGEAAGELIGTLLAGIVANLPLILESGSKLVTEWNTGLLAVLADIVLVGIALVDGLWEGISSQWETMKKNFGDLFGGLVKWIKDLLGIKSPSTVFAGIGTNLAVGLGNGFARAFDGIERDIAGAVGGLRTSVQLGGLGVGSMAGGQVNLGGIHVSANGSDAMSIGQAARRGANLGLVEALRARGEV